MNAPPFELAGIGILIIGFGLIFLTVLILVGAYCIRSLLGRWR